MASKRVFLSIRKDSFPFFAVTANKRFISVVILSVIIVSYNVKYFLEQNLRSLEAAAAGMKAEIIVVDNNSADNSVAYLRPLFPLVRFVENDQNKGFAAACNQGFADATGKYMLFLNPDTIIPEDALHRSVTFLETHPDAGALGIKMLDGRGRFLKESKRAFPGPVTSLYKLTGLSALFPRSRIFARYHLGHLDPDSNHRVDVLSGAYMMVSREVLRKTGGFDDTFFMYGEDIDLSYRIQQDGYQNYYFAETPIIHFKGESTRKASANYTRMFYRAMSIFVRKHYGEKRAGLFNFSIQFAIGVRGILSGLSGFIRRMGMPVVDALLLLPSFWIAKLAWNNWVKTSTIYDGNLLWISFSGLTAVYLLIAYYAGLYDRQYRYGNLLRTATVGTLAVLAAYSLLPEHYRFSRAIILAGATLAFILMALVRKLFLHWSVISASETGNPPVTIVTGSREEYEGLAGLLVQPVATAFIEAGDDMAGDVWSQLRGMPRAAEGKRELLFCVGQQPVRDLISHLPEAGDRMPVKIHYHGSGSVVGSDSTNKSGQALSGESRMKIAKPYFRRLKRLADLVFSLGSIVFFPVPLLFIRRPLRFFRRSFAVLSGRYTWVGYAGNPGDLPPLRPGILTPDGLPSTVAAATDPGYYNALNAGYAMNYDPLADLQLIAGSYRALGN
ncbi:MAG: glycosyltransferase [Chitinophagaceae bacterium]|nr:MAG: glycosyltransferase [Chitinophagaceae bacterium]